MAHGSGHVLQQVKDLVGVLSDEIVDSLTQWIEKSQSVNIFVTGKTGAGKSTLVNALVGRKIAKEGGTQDPMTSSVDCHRETDNGITVSVWDSPGLQDGTQREEEYIQDIKTKCTDIDIRVICINVSATRFTADSKELKALQKLTEAFGKPFWNHAVIALTFANELEMKNDDMRRVRKKNPAELSRLFRKKVAEWEAKIRAMLIDHIKLNPDLVHKIQIIPTGYRKPPSLPDRRHWLSSFWFAVLRSTHKKAQPALMILNQSRLVFEPDQVSKEEEDKYLEEQSLIFSERGYSVGEEVGIPAIGRKIGEEQEKQFKKSIWLNVILEQYAIYESLH